MNYESLESCLSPDVMGRMLDKGKEMVVVPVKKVNKLNDTFRELKTGLPGSACPCYYCISLFLATVGDGIRKGTVFGFGSVT